MNVVTVTEPRASSPTSIGVLSGRMIDLMAPDPALIRWRDIARGLPRAPRFGGQTGTEFTWSVADHLLVADDMVPIFARRRGIDPAILRPMVWLHDNPEYLIGDPPRPFKMALTALGGGPALRAIEAALQHATWLRFGVDPSRAEQCAGIVKEIDNAAYAYEVATLRPRFSEIDISQAEMIMTGLGIDGLDIANLPKPVDEAARIERFLKRWPEIFSPDILEDHDPLTSTLPKLNTLDYLRQADMAGTTTVCEQTVPRRVRPCRAP